MRGRLKMSKQSFNLVIDPWIKVIVKETNQEKLVSLTGFFKEAQNYQQLAGEMRSQDLAILRFLLAILTTVYSRFDANDEVYEWLDVDKETLQLSESVDDDEYDQSDLQETWHQLFQAGHFSEIVIRYLSHHQNQFDLFGARPFYQVTADQYDLLVPAKKRIASGSGTVSIKQINRLISESNNTPALFTPKSGGEKKQIALDELTRWLITYQNFTGVTDKTKIETDEKFATPAGWLYKLNPVAAKGKSVFETLMLNLILFNQDTKDHYIKQKPVWEYDNINDYVTERKKMILPDDVSSLYTVWARLLHIEWDKNYQPTIFSAGMPMYSSENAFKVEPMSTWKHDAQGGADDFKPAVKSTRSLGIAMWRNFGQYINVENTDGNVMGVEPGLITWLHILKSKGLIEKNRHLNLMSAVLVSDDKRTQAPAVEVTDDLTIRADVLFDTESTQRWPIRIENMIDTTQQIGKDFWQFAATIGEIRNLDKSSFASQQSAKFYEQLNAPFKHWLASLSNDDDRDAKELEWKHELKQIVLDSAEAFMQTSTSRDITGIIVPTKEKSREKNIFTANNHLRYNIQKHLEG